MKTNNALVSIIVPVYGTETYLPACIESICNQSYTNLQIILVDDQSPDRCPEICDSYARNDSRILVIHQNNTGVSGARNAGLRQAAGDFIMFVDSDDILYTDAVQTMLRDADEYDADIVSAIKSSAGANGKLSGHEEDGRINIFRDEQPLMLSLQGNCNTDSACAKLFRTSFLRGLFFENGKDIHEDGFFMFLCYLKNPVLIQHNVEVYQYNTRLGSNSRQAFTEKYLSILYFCERKKELMAKYYPELQEQTHNMEARANLQLLDVLCRTTDRRYRALQKQCVNTVRSLYEYHVPIHDHHKKLAWIVAHGLYPLYKWAVRLKYYR